MAGHMGNKIRTVQNLEIIKFDTENNLIFVKGSIPGSKNSFVLIKKPSKQINRQSILEKINKIRTQTIGETLKNEGITKAKNKQSSPTSSDKKDTEMKKEVKK